MAAGNKSRRDVLKVIGFVGSTWAVSQLLSSKDPIADHAASAIVDHPSSAIANLLPDYFTNTRANIVTRSDQRAILSSRLYPKAIFVRDAFYGPLALGDISLSADCYRWFVRSQLPHSGQIRTAVPFERADEPDFAPGDDDSSLLFIIWSAWLKRNRVVIDPAPVERAFAFVQSHVRDDQFITPAGAFRYWADTIKFEQPECTAHNQGLYMLALRALQALALGDVSDQQLANAQQHYRDFFRSELGAMTLGQDSWWADKLDLSALFPEFLLRWLYTAAALPDTMITSTIDHFRRVATVVQPDGSIAGLKTICASNGDFLDRQRFFEPGLNWPGDYHNGGYWPMYTLTALALHYRMTRDAAIKQLIEQLIAAELAVDHRSKEVIILAPDTIGTVNPERSGYTWNALIVPALTWAGVLE